MPTEVSADIAALCSRVGLQASKYREFPAPPGPQPDPQPAPAASEGAPEEAPVEAKVAALAAEPAPGAASVDGNRPGWGGSPRAGSEARRPAVNWRAVGWLLDGADRAGAIVEAPSLAVWSPAGGTGKTSLVAGLGQALASQGMRLLLGDLSPHSVLPLYFGEPGGAHRQGAGPVRRLPGPDGAPGPVFLLQSAFAPGDGQAAASELSAGLRSLQHQVDAVLLETGPNGVWGGRRCSLQLVPLLADLNAVAALQEIEAHGSAEHRWYLLNQFDPAQPLQRELRERLQIQLGSRLLPFVLRRDPALPEALAAGCSVFEYAPTAPVSEDLARLAQWLRPRLERLGATESGGAA